MYHCLKTLFKNALIITDFSKNVGYESWIVSFWFNWLDIWKEKKNESYKRKAKKIKFMASYQKQTFLLGLLSVHNPTIWCGSLIVCPNHWNMKRKKSNSFRCNKEFLNFRYFIIRHFFFWVGWHQHETVVFQLKWKHLHCAVISNIEQGKENQLWFCCECDLLHAYGCESIANNSTFFFCRRLLHGCICGVQITWMSTLNTKVYLKLLFENW